MSDPVNIDIVKVEGTAVLSTGEAGGSKFLREDGDGTCSWQSIPGGGDALTSNPLSQFAATTSAQLAGVISDETGSGALVFANTPTLVTPVLGTPTSGTLTNCTGLPVSTGVSGLGTGVATALAVNVGSAGAPVVLNGAGGTPSAITLTNGTGLPISTGVSGLGSNVATFLATPSSANLRAALTDETGAGAAMFTRTGVYRTIYVDAAAMVPRTTDGAEAATEEYATNDIMSDHYLFDGATTNEGVQFKMMMPDEWDGSTIKVKVFWDAASGASASDGVVWSISAGAISNDDAIDAVLGTAQTVTDTVIAVGDLHVSAATSALTVGGTPALGDLIWFEVERLQDNGSDTMAEDAKLLGIAIQYAESATEPSSW